MGTDMGGARWVRCTRRVIRTTVVTSGVVEHYDETGMASARVLGVHGMHARKENRPDIRVSWIRVSWCRAGTRIRKLGFSRRTGRAHLLSTHGAGPAHLLSAQEEEPAHLLSAQEEGPAHLLSAQEAWSAHLLSAQEAESAHLLSAQTSEMIK
ncbi:hypothetical protein L1987_08115 [Smallanthus sonchifolius]|uniref:Uncharacterized protein n=1 Tax=Smallanthus sonchifolius TaxID=185202 RepID=A0ACB9JJQ3_9ASTR|nr:hypothetical protein L1987_08115 [Smallanthus sonchifolius]